MTNAPPEITQPRKPRDESSDRLPDSVAGDLDLIRSTLDLSPEERLAMLQDFVDTFWTPLHG